MKRKETIGIAVGKFMPLHLGHMSMIMEASTKVDKLIVLLSHDEETMQQRCKECGIKPMPLQLRTQWLFQELKAFKDHIEIMSVDESHILKYPDGWKDWCNLVKDELYKQLGIQYLDVDYFIGSEEGYVGPLKKHFHNRVDYVPIDTSRSVVNISATELTKDVYRHWDKIPGHVRPYFVKKVLITGTESCGKSTMVKKLAKVFLTSWSEEFGKWYQEEQMGGYDGNWQVSDFNIIAREQLAQDAKAFKSANKVTFVDTDAVVTAFYLDIYLNKKSDFIGQFMKEEIGKWDLVIMLQPSVKWIDDGTRFNSEDKVRWELHEKLKSMYDELGIKYIELTESTYNTRFEKCRQLVEELLVSPYYEINKEKIKLWEI